MSLKIAIVGLPNVGKSTLFNSLTKTKSAQAENYPFCTIDPNIGIVEVPDERLHKLADVSSSEKRIPAIIEFVDVAGLVKGASEGGGLGNKFLSHIRECNAIAHVLRTFEDENITHVHGAIDPKQDREVIESELLLADLQTLEKRLEKAKSDAKSGDKDRKTYARLLERVREHLEQGVLLHKIDFLKEEKELLGDLHFLTAKPLIHVVNLHENELGEVDKSAYAKALGVDEEKVLPISAKVEEDLIGFSEEEAMQYLKEVGIEDSGLNNLIRAAYKNLGLITFFTSGPKESRAWTIKAGTLAPQAAGVIHTDFEKGFIKADVIDWNDFVNAGGESSAKESGKLRIEGRDYTVRDGDVIHFRFS